MCVCMCFPSDTYLTRGLKHLELHPLWGKKKSYIWHWMLTKHGFKKFQCTFLITASRNQQTVVAIAVTTFHRLVKVKVEMEPWCIFAKDDIQVGSVQCPNLTGATLRTSQIETNYSK